MSVEVVAVLAAVAVLVALAVNSVIRSRWPVRGEPLAEHERVHEAPLDVLKRRYASGEMTREEYDRERRGHAA